MPARWRKRVLILRLPRALGSRASADGSSFCPNLQRRNRWTGSYGEPDQPQAAHACRVADRRLVTLRRLSKLEQLNLNNTNIRDISALAHLTSLKRLSADGTKISDLQPLAALQNLSQLSLECSLLSNIALVRDVRCLALCKSLEVLELRKTLVRDISAVRHFKPRVDERLNLAQNAADAPTANLSPTPAVPGRKVSSPPPLSRPKKRDFAAEAVDIAIIIPFRLAGRRRAVFFIVLAKNPSGCGHS